MPSDAGDRYTVRISPELRRLRQGLKRGPAQPAADAAAASPAQPTPVAEVVPEPLRARSRSGTWMRLRRDGKRPVVFDGVQLACFTARSSLGDLEGGPGFRPSGTGSDTPDATLDGQPSAVPVPQPPPDAAADPAAEQTLEFFLARDGRVFAQMRLLVPPDLAARSTHRVGELASREDLHRFLSAHRPEDAFCVGMPDTADVDRQIHAVLSNLRADFARMTAPLLRDRFGETLT